MSFRPDFSRHRLWARIAVLVLFALALLAAIAIIRRPPGPSSVILGGIFLALIVTGALLITRLWSLRTLDYWVQRDAIRILWHGEEAVIPLSEIHDVRPANSALAPAWRHWPLQWVQSDAETQTLAYATQPPESCLTIITDKETYLVSPRQPDDFIAAWQERRDFGPARQLKQVIYLSFWRQHWLLRDRLAQALLFGGLLLGVIALGYVTWRYPYLPQTIALHFDAHGNPDLLSPRRSIYLLPGISLVTGFLNAAIGFALYDFQRFLSYLLWSVSVVLQIIIIFIAANLITLAVGG